VTEVLSRISQSADVTVLADSTVQQGRVPMPAQAATSGNIEQQLTTVTRSLPSGTIWGKLYLPAPAGGRWIADNVVQYAQAQARLLGKPIGGPTPAGAVEILGQQVPEEKGRQVIEALRLKLVYILTNPRASLTQMSPDQRQQYAQQFRNMDPGARVQAMMQMQMQMDQMMQPYHEMFSAMWSELSDDQKMQLKRTIGEMKAREGGK
jgi:hypothetical protein